MLREQSEKIRKSARSYKFVSSSFFEEMTVIHNLKSTVRLPGSSNFLFCNFSFLIHEKLCEFEHHLLKLSLSLKFRITMDWKPTTTSPSFLHHKLASQQSL